MKAAVSSGNSRVLTSDLRSLTSDSRITMLPSAGSLREPQGLRQGLRPADRGRCPLSSFSHIPHRRSHIPHRDREVAPTRALRLCGSGFYWSLVTGSCCGS